MDTYAPSCEVGQASSEIHAWDDLQLKLRTLTRALFDIPGILSGMPTLPGQRSQLDYAHSKRAFALSIQSNTPGHLLARLTDDQQRSLRRYGMIGDRLDVYDLDLLASEIPLEEPALRINRGDLIVAAEKASEAKVRFGRIGKWAHRLYDKIGEWSDYTFDFENRSRLWVGVTIATVALSVIGVEALGFYVQGREGNPQPAVSGQVHPHHHARTHGSTEIRR